ncbi:MAG: carboxypeptidase regulatory-like domain-containing protein, partial [Bryobacterales bacterium]|nr:carboxypeptidase regulatory-like domain-containing protein [Bryobacterales bacterium]
MILFLPRLLVRLLPPICLTAVLSAQTAQITGRVADSSGAVIAGAVVAIGNTETGVRREIRT